MSSSVADITGTHLGRYEVIDRLGSGGMAEVWLARQTGTAGFNKLVVIKTLHPHLAEDEGLVEMFIREASMAAALSHPNVVQILDLGFENGRYYMAMEFIAGVNLRRLVRELKKQSTYIPEWALLDIAIRVCDGLQYIHDHLGPEGEELNLVHRDLTPDNIMVSYTGNVKIVDFGVMRVHGIDKTGMGKMVGKPHYMAPEQILDESVDRRADLFSLGVVLYQYLAGRRPFTGAQAASVLLSVVNDKPRPPRQHNPDISARLEAIVMRCIARTPDARFDDAQELGDELTNYMYTKNMARNQRRLAMLVASAFPNSTQIPEQTRKLLRKHSISSPDTVQAPRLDASEEIELDTPSTSTQHLTDNDIDVLLLELSEFEHTPASQGSGVATVAQPSPKKPGTAPGVGAVIKGSAAATPPAIPGDKSAGPRPGQVVPKPGQVPTPAQVAKPGAVATTSAAASAAASSAATAPEAEAAGEAMMDFYGMPDFPEPTSKPLSDESQTRAIPPASSFPEAKATPESNHALGSEDEDDDSDADDESGATGAFFGRMAAESKAEPTNRAMHGIFGKRRSSSPPPKRAERQAPARPVAPKKKKEPTEARHSVWGKAPPPPPDVPPGQILFEEGHELYMGGQYDRALSKWEAACAEDPENRSYSANLRRLKKKIEDQKS